MSPYENEELISREERVDEQILCGLRTQRGWDAARTEAELAVPAKAAAERVAERHPKWCTFDGARLQPTRAGFLMNNALILACAQTLGGMTQHVDGGPGFP
jgi:coproporphyrinogen III oxidase-like Fe-S oxidoreductase